MPAALSTWVWGFYRDELTLKEMSFSALQDFLLLDFQKPLRAEVWALRKQVSLPGLVSTPCLARVGALCAPGAQLTCVQALCDCARFGVLLCHGWSRRVAVLPCCLSPALLGLEAPSSSALERSKPHWCRLRSYPQTAQSCVATSVNFPELSV